MSVVDSIKEAAEDQKERIEMSQYGKVAFSIINGKVRQGLSLLFYRCEGMGWIRGFFKFIEHEIEEYPSLKFIYGPMMDSWKRNHFFFSKQ